MAKAIAICTCKVCGKTFEMETVKSSRRDATIWEKWALGYYDVCSECEQRQREEKAAKLAAEAKKAGLPELTGTPKQIVWAEQLRAEFIENADRFWNETKEYIEDMPEKIKRREAEGKPTENYIARMERASKTVAQFESVRNYILNTKNEAKFWIDSRDYSMETFIRNYNDKAAEAKMKFEVDAEVEAEKTNADNTMYPENPQYGTATVTATDDTVTATYPKDYTFMRIVKSAGMKWNPNRRVWQIKINQFTGSGIDRAAEISVKLLQAGFSVKCDIEGVREKAIAGTYEPLQKRWVKHITEGTYAGWLVVKIPACRETRSFLRELERIKGVKRNGYDIYAPMSVHEMIEDFAEINNFSLSIGAKKAIAEFEAQRTNIVTPTAAEQEHTDKLSEIMKTDDVIISDLEDK